jgi:quercetin dioxygenase-like cupin family protein
MRVTWLYAGDDGRSHFEELDVPLQFAGHGSDSIGIASINTVLSEVPEGASIAFHPAKRRQFIIYLSGLVEMECGDGSTRRMGPGDILLADDTSGEGHRTRDIEGPRRCVHIWVSPDFDPAEWRVQA